MQIATDNGGRIRLGPSPVITDQQPATDDWPPTSVRCALSAVTGLLLVACFPSLSWNVLVWVACLPLLVAVVTEPSLSRAFLLGYLSGVIFLTGSCYWFVIAVEHYGGLSIPLAIGVLVLFALLFAVIFGLFGLGEAWVARHSRGTALALSPFLWVSLELLRTYYVTGFPWNLLGYAVAPTGLRQFASVTAVYGLSFLAASTSALLASAILLWRQRAFAFDGAALRIWATPIAWFVLLALMNRISTPPNLPPGTNEVYLLQPNAPLEESQLQRWAPWNDRQPLDHLVALCLEAACGGASQNSVAGGGQSAKCGTPSVASASKPLIVWSENPAPFFFSRDPIFRGAIEDLARKANGYVIFNTINFINGDNNKPLNSAMVLGPDGNVIMQYDKMHLVPFGEYVPWWAFPSKVGKILSEIGDFIPGTSYRSAQTADGAVAVPICYEDIFPQLVRRLTPKGPGVLVSISNDSWYGDSEARYQHLEMSSLRAIENGRYLLRATNDGVTAVIDPYGRVAAELPLHQAIVLSGRFSFLARQTFYNAHGDVFAWLCVGVTVGIAALSVRQGSRPKEES